MIDHGHLRRLAEAATPGPWVAGGASGHGSAYFGAVYDPDDLESPGPALGEAGEADAAFIGATGPDVVLGLLDEIAALRRGQGKR